MTETETIPGRRETTNGVKEPRTRRTLWQIVRVPLEPFTSFNPSDTAADQPKQPEGSSEGSKPPEQHPSQTLRDDTPPDLHKATAKDVKGPDATSLAKRAGEKSAPVRSTP